MKKRKKSGKKRGCLRQEENTVMLQKVKKEDREGQSEIR